MSETTLVPPQSEAETPENRFNLSSIALWVAVLGILALLGYGLLQAQATRPEAGEMAPNFNMQFFDGYGWEDASTLELADFQGKIVVLNFWASWCVECRLEADLLEQASRRYAAQDVVFLGVAYADVEPNAKEYLREFNITYPNAPDLGTAISADYEITGVPETFFIDRTGEIVHVQIGPVNAASMETIMSRLLAEGG